MAQLVTIWTLKNKSNRHTHLASGGILINTQDIYWNKFSMSDIMTKSNKLVDKNIKYICFHAFDILMQFII